LDSRIAWGTNCPRHSIWAMLPVCVFVYVLCIAYVENRSESLDILACILTGEVCLTFVCVRVCINTYTHIETYIESYTCTCIKEHTDTRT
jgi:hypothetical protein